MHTHLILCLVWERSCRISMVAAGPRSTNCLKMIISTCRLETLRWNFLLRDLRMLMDGHMASLFGRETFFVDGGSHLPSCVTVPESWFLALHISVHHCCPRATSLTPGGDVNICENLLVHFLGVILLETMVFLCLLVR